MTADIVDTIEAQRARRLSDDEAHEIIVRLEPTIRAFGLSFSQLVAIMDLYSRLGPRAVLRFVDEIMQAETELNSKAAREIERRNAEIRSAQEYRASIDSRIEHNSRRFVSTETTNHEGRAE